MRSAPTAQPPSHARHPQGAWLARPEPARPSTAIAAKADKPRSAPRGPAQQRADTDSANDSSSVPPPPPRAPKAQRQLFGALDALRKGEPAQDRGPRQGERSGGKAPKSGNRGPRGAGPAPGKQRSRNRADDGPEDVIILESPPAGAAAAAAAAAGLAAAGAAVTGAASSTVSAEDPDDLANDGAQVWRERLQAVGWSYDDDESDESEGEGAEGALLEDMDLEEGMDMDMADNEDLLLEVTPFGSWFAGEGGEQAEETARQQELRRWYTDKSGYLPAPQWGPIEVSSAAGSKRHLGPTRNAPKGPVRGIVTTQPLAAGNLVMVSEAVTLLEYETSQGSSSRSEEEGPENEDLAHDMFNRARVSEAQVLWLTDILTANRQGQTPSNTDTGTPSTSGGGRMPTADDIKALQADAGPKSALKSRVPSEQWLVDLVNTNCMGEEFKELAVASLRNEEAPGWLGLFPDAALINHSCAPNATGWVVGNRLIVRATQEVPKGGEVTLSYLGKLLTSPLEQRRAELRDKWGFHCTCVRCTAEEKVSAKGSPLHTAIPELYQWCQDMSEVLDTALEEEDYQEVKEIRDELIEKRDEFESLLRGAELKMPARRMLQASVYDLYDMLSICADEEDSITEATTKTSQKRSLSPSDRGDRAARSSKDTGGDSDTSSRPPALLDTENLAVCARILDSVQRGSDAQAYLAAEYMVRAGVRFGANHQETAEAKKLCQLAFTARFGPVSPSLMDQLIAARLDD